MSTPNPLPNKPDRTLRKRILAEKVNSIKQKQQKHENYNNSSIGKADNLIRSSANNCLQKISDLFFTYFWPPPTSALAIIAIPVCFYLLKRFLGIFG